jgi:hypothetical protein
MVVYLEYCIVYRLSCAIVRPYLMYLVQLYPSLLSYALFTHIHPSQQGCWKRVYLKLDPHRFSVLDGAHAEKASASAAVLL